MTRRDRMASVLVQEFAPQILEIVDESERHAGHAGAHPAGETHFRIVMQSRAFAGLGALARHRLVHDVLEPEFASGLHALSLDLRAPPGDPSGIA